jgi:uncharacterized protein (DUF302 family)
LLAVHDLKARMVEKGVEFAHHGRIFEVCNPRQATKVLGSTLRSTALPYRISV